LCPSTTIAGEFLSIFSRDLLQRIAEGDKAWGETVQVGVAELIKRRGFFGYIRSPV
jgi:hypothetical protein